MDREVPAPLTLAETRRVLEVDRARLAQCLRERAVFTGLAFSPSWMCVYLHRYAHYCYARGWRLRARILWHLALWLTGADISPMSELGEGLLVVHPFSVTITGKAGRNLTVEGWGGLGGGMSLEDIGAGPGVPVLGDDVLLGRNAMVLGPVRIGNRVRVGPGCTVVRDLADDAELAVPELRIRRGGATP